MVAPDCAAYSLHWATRASSGKYSFVVHEYRGYEQAIVEELAKYAGVPVWNGLTNEYHPTQMLADMLTIREHFGHLKDIRLTYMGDARYNMGNSLMIVCAKLGMHFTACTTKEYFPEEALVAQCREYATQSGATCIFCKFFHDRLLISTILNPLVHFAKYTCGVRNRLFLSNLRP